MSSVNFLMNFIKDFTLTKSLIEIKQEVKESLNKNVFIATSQKIIDSKTIDKTFLNKDDFEKMFEMEIVKNLANEIYKRYKDEITVENKQDLDFDCTTYKLELIIFPKKDLKCIVEAVIQNMSLKQIENIKN